MFSNVESLCNAVREGNKVEVLSFIEDVDSMDDKGNTALHYSIISGNEDMTEFLLTNKADPNRCDSIADAMKPLFTASQMGHTNIVRLLLRFGADIKDCGRDIPLLLLATTNHYPDVVRTLVELSAEDPNIDLDITFQDEDGRLYTAEQIASLKGFTDILAILQKGGRGTLHGWCVGFMNQYNQKSSSINPDVPTTEGLPKNDPPISSLTMR
jgi:ankyrin repeat protein